MNSAFSLSEGGILLLDKPKNKTSFYLVHLLRKLTKIKKIGHCGTLDPFATGLMIMLVGKNYTKQSDLLIQMDKSYEAVLCLGKATNSYDCDGIETLCSEKIPTQDQVQTALDQFQGTISQIPPMFSAKKVAGKKLYELARKGEVIDRKPSLVHISIEYISYAYPFLTLRVDCSKGTYIRSLAHDIGMTLGCYAHLTELRRVRSGPYSIEDSLSIENLLSLFERT